MSKKVATELAEKIIKNAKKHNLPLQKKKSKNNK